MAKTSEIPYHWDVQPVTKGTSDQIFSLKSAVSPKELAEYFRTMATRHSLSQYDTLWVEPLTSQLQRYQAQKNYEPTSRIQNLDHWHRPEIGVDRGFLMDEPFIAKYASTVQPGLIKILADSREVHVVKVEGKLFAVRHEQCNMFNKVGHAKTSTLISRIFVAAKHENDILFIGRTRRNTTTKGVEVPGGKAGQIQLKSEQSIRFLGTEVFQSPADTLNKEVEEEFSGLLPIRSSWQGAFLTHGRNGADNFLETCLLVNLPRRELEEYCNVGNRYLADNREEGDNPWQVLSINEVLRSTGTSVLPSLLAVLARVGGDYLMEHDGWKLIGEYISFTEPYFATRRKRIPILK